MFRGTPRNFSHWISTFCSSFWNGYTKRKQISQFLQRNFAQIFAQTPLKEICTILVFLEYTYKFCKFCKYSCIIKFSGSRAFLKRIICHSSCNFCVFFCKFVQICYFSSDYLRRAQELSKNVSNVIDLYQEGNRWVWGGVTPILFWVNQTSKAKTRYSYLKNVQEKLEINLCENIYRF